MSIFADEQNKEFENLKGKAIENISIFDEGEYSYIKITFQDGCSVKIEYDYIYEIQMKYKFKIKKF